MINNSQLRTKGFLFLLVTVGIAAVTFFIRRKKTERLQQGEECEEFLGI